MTTPEPIITAAWTTRQLRQNLTRVLNPAVCAQVLRSVDQPNSDFGKLADLLRADPFIATKVTSMATLLLPEGEPPLTSLERAVQVLGLRRVRMLMICVMLAGPLMSRDLHTTPRLDLWRWVFAMGIAAEAMVKTAGKRRASEEPLNEDEAMLRGLILGLGPLVLHAGLGREYERVLGTRLRPLDLVRREKREWGVSHHQVTLWTLKSLGASDGLEQGAEALLSDEDTPLRRWYRAVEVAGARLAALQSPEAAAWLSEALPHMRRSPDVLERQLTPLRKRLRQFAGALEVELPDWPTQQQQRQSLLVEAASGLESILRDNLALERLLVPVAPAAC
ncbi:MAG: HDOD domain-containing protein [Phycisphaeraceae bacterium]|nr:HDOD domain-containing protein [Phycisphaeraceae bacterium]